MIYVAGQPHVMLGGANSEALDNVAVLRQAGIPVTLVHFNRPHPLLVKMAEDMGCAVKQYYPGIFRNRIVAGWNHLDFLRTLAMDSGKPRCAVNFNCMTSTSRLERGLHQAGMITIHGFVSNYQRDLVCAELPRDHKVNVMEGYKPPVTLAWRTFGTPGARSTGAIGVLTRDDPGKVNQRIFNIVGKTQARKLIWMGYGPCCREAHGLPKMPVEFEHCACDAMSMKQFFNSIDICLHIPGSAGESFCRIMPESWLSGVPFIAERGFAFPEYMGGSPLDAMMCKEDSEFVSKINGMLASPDQRDAISAAQFAHLKSLQLNEQCLSAWKGVLARYA